MDRIPKEKSRPMRDAQRFEFIRLFVIGLQDELNDAHQARCEIPLNQETFTAAVMISRADGNVFAEHLRLYQTPQGPRSRDFRSAVEVAETMGIIEKEEASAAPRLRVTDEQIKACRQKTEYWDIRALARAYLRTLSVIPLESLDRDRLRDEFDRVSVEVSDPEKQARLNMQFIARIREENRLRRIIPLSHDRRRIRSAVGQGNGGGHG